MKPFADYEKTEAFQGGERLPKGAYVLKVLNVEVKREKNFNGVEQDRLYLSCDIAEGEYAGFYMQQYMGNASEDKKWKCVYKMWLPFDDGSDADKKTKRIFKTNILYFEASNEGYHWDWNELGLKGKLVGGLFNDKEYDFNGRRGWFTNFKFLCPVHQIADESYKMPADEPLPTNKLDSFNAAAGFIDVPDDASDAGLPWN